MDIVIYEQTSHNTAAEDDSSNTFVPFENEYDYSPQTCTLQSSCEGPTKENCFTATTFSDSKPSFLTNITDPLTIFFDPSNNKFGRDYHDALLSSSSIASQITSSEFAEALEDFSTSFRSFYIVPIRIFKAVQIVVVSLEASLFLCIILIPIFLFFYDVNVGYISLIVCFVIFSALFMAVLCGELILLYFLQKLLIKRATRLMEMHVEQKNASLQSRGIKWTFTLESSFGWSNNSYYDPVLQLTKR